MVVQCLAQQNLSRADVYTKMSWRLLVGGKLWSNYAELKCQMSVWFESICVCLCTHWLTVLFILWWGLIIPINRGISISTFVAFSSWQTLVLSSSNFCRCIDNYQRKCSTDCSIFWINQLSFNLAVQYVLCPACDRELLLCDMLPSSVYCLDLAIKGRTWSSVMPINHSVECCSQKKRLYEIQGERGRNLLTSRNCMNSAADV